MFIRAQAWARSLREPFIVTEYVVVETIDSLSEPADRSKANALVDQLRQSSSIEWVSASPDLFRQRFALHSRRSDKAWSLTDCISFVVMRERGIQRALAHDRHFEQFGVEALLRRDP